MKAFDEGRDERVTEILRERVAPPADPGYWDALEARIMARIAGEQAGEWWFAIGTSWMRAGLVAAGIAVLVASAAFWQTRATEAQVAYDAVIDHPPTAASSIADAAPRARTDREETLRYLMAH